MTCSDCGSSLSGRDGDSSTVAADLIALRFLRCNGAGLGAAGDLSRERRLRAGAPDGAGTTAVVRGIGYWRRRSAFERDCIVERTATARPAVKSCYSDQSSRRQHHATTRPACGMGGKGGREGNRNSHLTNFAFLEQDEADTGT